MTLTPEQERQIQQHRYTELLDREIVLTRRKDQLESARQELEEIDQELFAINEECARLINGRYRDRTSA